MLVLDLVKIKEASLGDSLLVVGIEAGAWVVG